jgi:glutamate/tyrosine decarboxylase-like PLP-dependent enzyme
MYWEKKSHEAIKKRVFDALEQNENYGSRAILGIPGTYLDTEEFHHDAPFLKDAPFLSTLVANPNHIGCHTLNKDKSETIFRGTQKIEIELIELISTEIFKSEPESIDGYIAPGGTEANIQALWIYRNFFKSERNAKPQEIAVMYSEDSHYSMPKGANLLGIQQGVVKVTEENRALTVEAIQEEAQRLREQGVKYFIFVANMATTMFGSVDDIDLIVSAFDQPDNELKIHVDGAFGGFIYPFTSGEENKLNFSHPYVSSITLDAHKMLQAPFGTGIFLSRKGLMQYAGTDEAKYVPGLDYTICGSRSGANVIAVWMILHIHGSEGWMKKLQQLIGITDRCANKLDELGIRYFRNSAMNIIAIDARDISDKIAHQYRLVANSYEDQPRWWKIVVMPHVKEHLLDQFLEEIEHDRLEYFQS